MGTLSSTLTPPPGLSSPRDLLTPRQREVLDLMARGHANIAIARSLRITEKSVVRHTSQIYDRLGLFADEDDVHRRVLAVVRYLSSRTAA